MLGLVSKPWGGFQARKEDYKNVGIQSQKERRKISYTGSSPHTPKISHLEL